MAQKPFLTLWGVLGGAENDQTHFEGHRNKYKVFLLDFCYIMSDIGEGEELLDLGFVVEVAPKLMWLKTRFGDLFLLYVGSRAF